jgi:CheY-like chemotaxis protein
MATKPPVKKAIKADGSAIKVLVIDDDPFIAGIYTLTLTKEGFEVTLARDGFEGIKLAASLRPDIIMLDILMPGIDGFETLRRLKRDEALKGIPVVILTSLAQKEDVEQGMNLGATSFLRKTQTLPTDCLAKIREVLKL